MPKYILLVALSVSLSVSLLASPAAQANPALKQANPALKKDVEEAVKREQRIKELSLPPRSVHNICKSC
jgi:hypothetical protein